VGKSYLCRLILGISILALSTWLAKAEVTLTVMNPRGEILPPAMLGIRPRVTGLDGKKIALCENGKAGAANFLDAVEEVLKQRFPSAVILRFPKPQGDRVIYDAKEWYPAVARQADTFIFATGD
jgi:hypothetical protein